ncbi:MAG: GGDEF domain-containing protein [Desulfovibrio sp.]|nr:GGDEF domain-containing protein [Desulfovibrio sp.]
MTNFSTTTSSISMNSGTDFRTGLPAARPRNARRFTNVIAGELARISRGRDELSLVCAAVIDRGNLRKELGAAALARAENALASAMRPDMRECDSLGRIAEGRHALLLPGVGLSAARLRGEQTQASFARKMRRQYKTGDLKITCALGIVCIGRDELCAPGDLLERGCRALQNALAQRNVHICLERPALSEHSTLVRSCEKRFLFFGEG